MSEQAQQATKDKWDAELDDREAINLIMELYGVDETIASELWQRFIGTVKKMSVVAAEKQESGTIEP